MQHTYVIFAGKYVLGYYTNDGKCMYTSASDHIVDCNKFICSIYANIVVSCAC